jgi:hypothetical protein
MRGRQQYYLTIRCASNRPKTARHPRRDMPIFRGQGWAGWDYAQPLRGLGGMSSGGDGQRGACPFFEDRGRLDVWGPGTTSTPREWPGQFP